MHENRISSIKFLDYDGSLYYIYWASYVCLSIVN